MVLLNHFDKGDGIYLFPQGYIGVGFFFILSGFILSYSQKPEIRNNIRKFYVARFARIYPLHVITFCLVLFLLWIKDNPIDIKIAVINLFLLQSFIPVSEYHFSINTPSWSISNEMFFYLLFPFVVQFAISKSVKCKLVFLFLLTILYLLTLTLTSGNLQHYFAYVAPFYRFIEFYIGMLLYSFWKDNPLDSLERESSAKIIFTLLELFAVVFLMCFVLFSYKITWVLTLSFYYWLPMGLLIFVFAYSKGYISDIISKRFFVYLGEISFAFYLFHVPVIGFINPVLKHLNFTSCWEIKLLIFLLAIVLISFISYEYVEKPANKWIRKKFNI